MDPITFAQLNAAYHKGVYGQGETLDIQEWVEALIEEGYDLDEYTDDELYEAYLADLDEARVDDNKSRLQKERDRNERHGSASHYFSGNLDKQNAARRSDHEQQRGVTKVNAGLPARKMSEPPNLLNYKNRFNEPRPEDKKRVGPQRTAGQYERFARGMKDVPSNEKSKTIKAIKKSMLKRPKVRVPLPEELDLYDLVSEYLVSEGFCDSYEDADVIMANMSEEWRDGILDEVTGGGQIRFRKGLSGRSPKKAGMGETPQKKAARKLGRMDVDPTTDPARRERQARVTLR
jgi:hypothetical protein